MAAFLVFAKGLLGNSIVQYLGIGLAGLIGLAILRHEFVSPYKVVIADQQLASKQKDAIIEQDAVKQLADAEQSEREKAELNEHISKLQADACRPTADELKRLRRL